MKKIRLHNTSGTHNKFYEMNETGNGDFVASWGRIGNSIYPQQKSYPMSDWDKVLNAKISKGYVVAPQPKKPAKRKASKRLVDVLDDKLPNRTFWDNVFGKLQMLQDKIEATNPSIDDPELRWVSDRIEYWISEERILSKGEMVHANQYWRKYK
jgi:predicted DNA-binding WGR domain protein